MAKKSLPSPDVLRRLLTYNPETGKLFWNPRDESMFSRKRIHLSWNSKNAGKEAFTASSRGYKTGGVFDQRMFAHRVIWAIYYGEWPGECVDHINCNKSDNRIVNLRAASKSENGMNRSHTSVNKAGLKGAYWSKREQKWESKIKREGVAKFLGYYSTPEAAHDAYKRAVVEYHGEFARVYHGSEQ